MEILGRILYSGRHETFRFHGVDLFLPFDGRVFNGVVIEARMQSTALIEWPRTKYVQKFERYETARTRVKAHNPPCIDAKPGDLVEISECKPISKTKHFVIVNKVGHEKLFAAEKELMEEAKIKKAAKVEEKVEENESS